MELQKIDSTLEESEISIAGEVDVNDLGSIYRNFYIVLEQNPCRYLCVDTRNVEDSDQSLAFLLMSLQRQFSRYNITLDIYSKMGDVVKNIITNAGVCDE